MEKKTVYGFDYWLSELQQAGAKITPEKYTPEYTATLQKAWRKQPLTDLVARTVKRRKEGQPANTDGRIYQCKHCYHYEATPDHCSRCGRTDFELGFL